MAPPKGNRFWEARTKHGRDLLFKTPEILWEACCEYFDWTDANPLQEEKGFAFQGEVTRESFGKMRAMTLSGLCLFLDIDENTWRLYREREDFIKVCTRAEKIIYNQKFQGAAADMLNASIIARDLGLKDATSSESTIVVDMKVKMAALLAETTPQQAEDIYKSLLG